MVYRKPPLLCARLKPYGACCLFLFLPSINFAFETLVPNPQPFRGYEFEGRTYDLEHYGLLHRFSYLPNENWLLSFESGLISSIGSVTSKDFYSLLYLGQSWELDPEWSIELRSERGEDFDNRYSSTQVGVSYQLSQTWSVAALSELQAVKQNEDLQLELVYQTSHHNRLRLAVVAVDWVHNKKQRDGEFYSRQPYTLFAELSHQISEKHAISGYVNVNLPMTVSRDEPALIDDNAHRLEYENNTLDLNWYYRYNDSLNMRMSLHGEQGTRERFRPTRYGKFERDYFSFLIEATRYDNNLRQFWVGARYLKFDEYNEFYHSETAADSWQRRGHMIYGGVDFYLANGWIFSPTVFVEDIDHQQTIWAGEGTGPNFDETFIKVSFPFQYNFKEERVLIINPTYELDQNNFGGLNIQLLIPF